MMCSLVDQIGGAGVSARHAAIGGTFWAGVGLIALLSIVLRLFLPGRNPTRRRILTGIALLAITGLDILPALFFMFLYARGLVPFVQPGIELWNEHVEWFVATTMCTPHATAALIACFTGFLLLWDGREWRRYTVLASLAFASAAGESVYVTFVFAIFLALWVGVGLWKKWYREAVAICASGLLSLLLAIPFLRELAGPGGGIPFSLTVREFSLAALVPSPGLPLFWRRILVNGSLLPFNYLLEFGLFFLVARYKWKQHRDSGRPASKQDLAMTLISVVSLVLCTFVRSDSLGNNDFGWRGLLPAQFVLLLWAVDLFAARETLTFLNSYQRQLLTVFFALGFAGTVTDLALVRLYPILADRGVTPPVDWMSPDRDLGHRLFAERAAYEWLHRVTPETAIIQANPQVVTYDVAGLTYSERPAILGEYTCRWPATSECRAIASRLMTVFPPDGRANAASLRDVCSAFPIDSIVAKDTDAVWANPQSWVWLVPPAYSNRYVRVFRCNQSAGPDNLRSQMFVITLLDGTRTR
jgi:hypothetical protein